MNFERLSGLSAILAGLTYIIGFWVFFSVLGPAEYGSLSVPAKDHIRFLIDNRDFMLGWNLIIYVLNAVLMVLIVVGLHARVAERGGRLAQTATAFGLIWAGLILAAGMVNNIGTTQIVRLADIDMDAAVQLWRSVIVVGSGLGGGNEITGGLWIFLISLAAHQANALPMPVNALGCLIGLAGIISTIPPLASANMIFGLGFILWFFAVGLVLVVNRPLAKVSER
ncbi:MAG: DUF4386 domain-containing protein [Pseudomonadota bacterium]